MPSKRDKPIRAVLDIRGLPIEAYRLPTDARKWKAVATQRRSLLLELATYADPDGTLGKYSPKMARLLTTGRAEKTLYRHLDQLKELGLLTWTREAHYGKRCYQILIPVNAENHLSDSEITPVILEENTCQIQQEHLSNSTESPVTFAANTCHIHAVSFDQTIANNQESVVNGLPPSLPSIPSEHPSTTPRIGDAVVDSGSTAVGGQGKTNQKPKPKHLTESEMMTALRREYEKCPARAGALRVTSAHTKEALEFFRKYGLPVGLAAWWLWLIREDHMVTEGGKSQARAWLLKDFISGGYAET